LVTLRTEREVASANLEFEQAAALHAQVQKVEQVRALASELVRPLSQLRAVILQSSADSDEVAVFLFENGKLRGPAAFSTLGMRIQNEQSGSSSLFAQPLAIEPVPEKQGSGNSGQGTENRDQEVELGPAELGNAAGGGSSKLARGMLEARMEAVLTALASSDDAPSSTVRQGHLALLKRWYYRPEVKRTGEIFFPDAEGHWPVKALLRGAGRVAAKMLTSASS
jgi:excinuclease ABC subunit C